MNPLHGQTHGTIASPGSVNSYTEEDVRKAHQVLYNEGLKMRYQVAGREHVDRALKAADNPFAQPMQEYATTSAWSLIWTRPGLDLKTRSFLTIAMTCAQNRSPELAVHVRGALNNGASEDEIREVILQAACYCGMPAGMEGFRVARGVIEEWHRERRAAEKHQAHERYSDVGIEMRTSMEDL